MGVSETAPGLRLDKWLWHARFFKTRSLATKYCEARRLRVNGEPTAKAHYAARIGDVLTFPLGDEIRGSWRSANGGAQLPKRRRCMRI